MITKEDARRFCAAYNHANIGDDVPAMLGGSRIATVTKRDGQIESTYAAHQWLSEIHAEGIKRLNALTR